MQNLAKPKLAVSLCASKKCSRHIPIVQCFRCILRTFAKHIHRKITLLNTALDIVRFLAFKIQYFDATSASLQHIHLALSVRFSLRIVSEYCEQSWILFAYIRIEFFNITCAQFQMYWFMTIVFSFFPQMRKDKAGEPKHISSSTFPNIIVKTTHVDEADKVIIIWGFEVCF